MPNTSISVNSNAELAERALTELTAASNALDRLAAVIRAISQTLLDAEQCPPDALSLVQVGTELCETYSSRFDGAAGFFERAAVSLREHHTEDSSQGWA